MSGHVIDKVTPRESGPHLTPRAVTTRSLSGFRGCISHIVLKDQDTKCPQPPHLARAGPSGVSDECEAHSTEHKRKKPEAWHHRCVQKPPPSASGGLHGLDLVSFLPEARKQLSPKKFLKPAWKLTPHRPTPQELLHSRSLARGRLILSSKLYKILILQSGNWGGETRQWENVGYAGTRQSVLQGSIIKTLIQLFLFK